LQLGAKAERESNPSKREQILEFGLYDFREAFMNRKGKVARTYSYRVLSN